MIEAMRQAADESSSGGVRAIFIIVGVVLAAVAIAHLMGRKKP